MNVNSSLDALGNLLALIQESNPGFAAVTADQLTVQSITAQAADAAGRNAVALVAVTGYDDSAAFTFTRLGLADSVVTAPTSVSVSSTDTVETITAAIAAALNVVASEISLTGEAVNADGTITVPAAAADGSVSLAINVVSNAGSYLYADGSTQAITLDWPNVVVTPPVLPLISTIVTNASLNGFTAVTAPVTPPVTPPVVTPPATDGTTPAAPATDGTTPAAPAADGTTPAAPVAPTPVADGTTSASTDGQSAPVATPPADGQASTN
jgi:hypothetical protein